MPHFIMEYSANLDDDLDIPALFEQLNDTRRSPPGYFPLAVSVPGPSAASITVSEKVIRRIPLYT